jgi:hypothetical protein
LGFRTEASSKTTAGIGKSATHFKWEMDPGKVKNIVSTLRKRNFIQIRLVMEQAKKINQSGILEYPFATWASTL